jgi:hypothetical protein
VKEVDDTPLPESESVDIDIELEIERLDERIDELLLRIANLETQRTPQDENDDPEWF